MTKYEKLYELAKEDFDAETQRLGRIESKATRLLSVLTLLIGVHGLLAEWAFDRVLPPNSLTEWSIVALIALVVAGLVTSWVFVFRVLTVDHRPAIAVTDEVADFYDQNRLVDIYYVMSRRIGDAAAENCDLGQKKARRLTNGYLSLMATGVLLLVLLGASAYYKWDTFGNIPATDSEHEGGQHVRE